MTKRTNLPKKKTLKLIYYKHLTSKTADGTLKLIYYKHLIPSDDDDTSF